MTDFAIADVLQIPVPEVEALDDYWRFAALAMLDARQMHQEAQGKKK